MHSPLQVYDLQEHTHISGDKYFSSKEADDQRYYEKKLFKAIKTKNPQAISKCFLGNFVLQDISDVKTQELLQEAVKSGSFPVFELLFDPCTLFAKCTLLQKATELSFLLVLACKHGAYDITKYLLNYKAPVNGMQTQKGLCTRITPLLVACIHSHKKNVELLLSYGANVDLGRTNEGNTALGVACLNGDLDNVVSLFNAHANPFLKNNDGLSAIKLAENHPHICCLFTEHTKRRAKTSTASTKDTTNELKLKIRELRGQLSATF